MFGATWAISGRVNLGRRAGDRPGADSHAFAFDQHVAAAGFTRIPVDVPVAQV